MSCYLIARATIDDPGTYGNYIAGFRELIGGYDAQVLVVDEDPEVIEGPWPYSRVAVIRFSSREEAYRWYDSSEYQQLVRDYRLPSSTAEMIFAAGRD
jgi:uncharacterized protein (DUF1330 family)